MRVMIYGGGLAGSEAALTLAKLGVKVDLYEEKTLTAKPVYKTDKFAELVCSNSLKAKRPYVASGMLKGEALALGSTLLQYAKESAVEAGGALAVDRDCFADKVTDAIQAEPLITVHPASIKALCDDECYQLVATGPLTDMDFLTNLQTYLSSADNKVKLAYFFDAQAPLIEKDSIDFEHAFYMSRYERGEAAYLNCPMNKAEYTAFYEALISAERAEVHDFERKLLFQGCMPVEQIAMTGYKSLLFGPLKPVGLVDPVTGKRPYACVQLRQDNMAKTLYNIVGFQTQLKWPEQKRVFGLIPALKEASLARYGVMHRNSYLHSPAFLTDSLASKYAKSVYFAGQITGMEGYVPAIASGLWAALNIYVALQTNNSKNLELPQVCMLGSLIRYICTEQANFQPMTANLGILPELAENYRDKRLKGKAYAKRSIQALTEFFQTELWPLLSEHTEFIKCQTQALQAWQRALDTDAEEIA
ncbi:methylenetetrahydrofolate--tRNA-(uracil(54)-C(5))-methyltransferase (FADH(2)-oxidizing) TrmFO [Amygdalobacter nucleatus]|uniref:Methylenetetrahydrofolate--tRNA-(uracil-5-)-methyltransferase TrmFO n=1 Tax=Amygdalobacter nucleatus TaxID=3029274 RepID=A0A133YEA4_9FIRM|nr:methylenetetrahydrofolate--tRNA-(uracil(54)-C(5))-methyltransferase (FADH(2)-oxidizing) TrmFO [Amygdalobacter nucleatus]KXB41539.1 tRNA (uracil-5-)-methyltransferase Gid [Amygdalobacter nucleatus]MDF0485622.1 methylenetetrahydrofolate--tRNA-(uracil(54)-C(5))-methyltransferase (FADH(2)-oxidizing) TrmFO [Amygdalobacter nucleatus]